MPPCMRRPTWRRKPAGSPARSGSRSSRAWASRYSAPTTDTPLTKHAASWATHRRCRCARVSVEPAPGTSSSARRSGFPLRPPEPDPRKYTTVRVRDHIALSTAAATLLYPRLRRSVVTAWAASVFIDVDHYLWYAIRHRHLNPATAVRSFNGARAPQHSQTRLLHHPAVLASLWLTSARRPSLRP